MTANYLAHCFDVLLSHKAQEHKNTTVRFRTLQPCGWSILLCALTTFQPQSVHRVHIGTTNLWGAA